MTKREGVWESRYLPLRERPYVDLCNCGEATCSRCGQKWHSTSRTQYSPCCWRPRVARGATPQMLPPRHPFFSPVPGDRLSRTGGQYWREVLRVADDIVVYRSNKADVIETHCNIAAWREWAKGPGPDMRCPARVDRRGDV